MVIRNLQPEWLPYTPCQPLQKNDSNAEKTKRRQTTMTERE